MANKTKYQRSSTELIHRSELMNAPYNPRQIGKDEKKRLKAMLKKHGLVNTPTWNKRTGNIVGGHQRIAALDLLEGTKDYALEVSVIDVDEKEEVELNIVLNNQSIQGEYETDLLAELMLDFNIQTEDIGFTSLDIDFMFNGDDRFSELFDPPEVDEEKNALQDIKDAREEGKERLADRNNIDFLTVLVFRDEDERKEFHKTIGVPAYEDYISLEQLDRYIDAKLEEGAS
ncbi:ParB N-terminal domain-containing protein [Enterococcus sp. DIV0800]|uniref:ParB N-terminal domain-containing protein n=1 Tax=unclassified Enterococcus TaxID=2608891 RepID=UPI003D3000BE